MTTHELLILIATVVSAIVGPAFVWAALEMYKGQTTRGGNDGLRTTVFIAAVFLFD
jgi:hypothetical protein